MAKTGFILGAAGHFWYNYLDWKFPGTHFRTLAKKLAVEMMAGPPFALMTFVSLGFFEKKSLATSVNNFKDNLIWVCLVRIVQEQHWPYNVWHVHFRLLSLQF